MTKEDLINYLLNDKHGMDTQIMIRNVVPVCADGIHEYVVDEQDAEDSGDCETMIGEVVLMIG